MHALTLEGQIAGGAMWTSASIMALAYGILVTERINRAIVAILGAALMVLTGLLTQEEAIQGIDFNTIGLLTGMMVLVGIARRTGMFEYLAIWAAQHARAEPWAVLIMLSIATAVLSALLDNVTTVLLIVPVTLALTRTLEVPPYPFLFAEVLASNIGGTATLIGDPPNIIIGSQVGLSFSDFLINLAPVVVVILAIQVGIIHLVWGRKLRTTEQAKRLILASNPAEKIHDYRLLKHALFVLTGVIVGFTFAHFIGLEAATIAMMGAAVMLLLYVVDVAPDKQTERTHHILSEVEWITIFFFIGLFVIVHGVEASGLLHMLAQKLTALTEGDTWLSASLIIWASALLSSIVDNIPFVATMIPVIRDMGATVGPEGAAGPLWWSLALGACLGGNGSLIGASANLIVAGIAEREGIRFAFLKFSAPAFPMMILSIAIAHFYIWLRYF